MHTSTACLAYPRVQKHDRAHGRVTASRGAYVHYAAATYVRAHVCSFVRRNHTRVRALVLNCCIAALRPRARARVGRHRSDHRSERGASIWHRKHVYNAVIICPLHSSRTHPTIPPPLALSLSTALCLASSLIRIGTIGRSYIAHNIHGPAMCARMSVRPSITYVHVCGARGWPAVRYCPGIADSWEELVWARSAIDLIDLLCTGTCASLPLHTIQFVVFFYRDDCVRFYDR